MPAVINNALMGAIKDSLKQLIIAALLPSATAIGSKFASGSWLKWFESPWVRFVLALVVFFLIFKMRKVVKSYGKTELASGSIPPDGWEELKRISHDNVIWVVLRDGRGRDANRLFPRNDPRPREICIKTPAVCPNCETELKETRRFWGGFTWHCIKCEFKKHSKASFYEASKNVERLARREIESSTGFSSDG